MFLREVFSCDEQLKKCVRVSVFPCFRVFVPFFLLVSLESIGVLSSLKVFQWCFKKVLRVFTKSVKEV